jgi:hypothetical protein
MGKVTAGNLVALRGRRFGGPQRSRRRAGFRFEPLFLKFTESVAGCMSGTRLDAKVRRYVPGLLLQGGGLKVDSATGDALLGVFSG